MRGNRIFRHFTRRDMTRVHLYFVKLFGCMIAEAKANGYDVPIDLGVQSRSVVESV